MLVETSAETIDEGRVEETVSSHSPAQSEPLIALAPTGRGLG